MPYMIREAGLADADKISGCMRESFKKYIPLIQQEPEPMVLDYADVIREKSVFVLEENSEFIGALVLADGDETYMWLDIVGLYSQYQNKGYGKKLIEFGECIMLKRGAKESRVYTNIKFEANIKLYEKMGYVEYDRKTEHGYDRVYLKKTLPVTAISRIAGIVHGHEVFIQGHNFPDADSLASAYGMKRLLDHKGIDSDIIYVGMIEKFTISRMLDVLGIEITLDEHEDRLTEDDHIIIVDAQKFNSNIKDCTGDEVVCIDHHPVTNEPEYLFCDIRPDVGACSSIIASYFFEAGITPDQKTATALVYGIKMDTLDLKRGAGKFDVEMFSRLFPLADTEILTQMQSNSMKFDDLMAFGEAIKNIQVYENIGISRLDVRCSDGLIAEISDFILDLNEVELCAVYAIRENGIKISVRSELKDIKAGIAIARALEGIGTGGGHDEMAGGFIPIANVTEHLDDEMRVRFLKAFRECGNG